MNRRRVRQATSGRRSRLDPDPKLIVFYLTGRRGTNYGPMFMSDLAGRLSGRIQLTTNQHPAPPPAVEEAVRDLLPVKLLTHRLVLSEEEENHEKLPLDL